MLHTASWCSRGCRVSGTVTSRAEPLCRDCGEALWGTGWNKNTVSGKHGHTIAEREMMQKHFRGCGKTPYGALLPSQSSNKTILWFTGSLLVLTGARSGSWGVPWTSHWSSLSQCHMWHASVGQATVDLYPLLPPWGYGYSETPTQTSGSQSSCKTQETTVHILTDKFWEPFHKSLGAPFPGQRYTS